MMDLTPGNRNEQMLDNILRTVSGEAVTDELVPGNDDEKFYDDILKAAGGSSPLYNLTPRWRHQEWLSQIAAKLAEGGGGGNANVKFAQLHFTNLLSAASTESLTDVGLSVDDFAEASGKYVFAWADVTGLSNTFYYDKDEIGDYSGSVQITEMHLRSTKVQVYSGMIDAEFGVYVDSVELGKFVACYALISDNGHLTCVEHGFTSGAANADYASGTADSVYQGNLTTGVPITLNVLIVDTN